MPAVRKDRIASIHAFLRRSGETIDDADDLIQEALLRMHVYGQTRPITQPEAFLKRTARNLAVDRVRKRHDKLYAKQRPEELTLPDLRPSPEEHHVLLEDLDAIDAKLKALPPLTREIFLMRRLEGCSHLHISRKFAVSISCVEKHIGRAALAIRK